MAREKGEVCARADTLQMNGTAPLQLDARRGLVRAVLIWRALPYVQPGSAIVIAAKRETLPFPGSATATLRTVVFGNSKVLTAFLPATLTAR